MIRNSRIAMYLNKIRSELKLSWSRINKVVDETVTKGEIITTVKVYIISIIIEVKYRIYGLFGFNVESKAIEANGVEMLIDPHDPGISRQLMCRSTREPRLTGLLQSYLQEGMVTIDIGANIGYFALLEAKEVKSSGQVYAFEPNENTSRLLSQSCKRNGFDNIEVISKGISNSEGVEKMMLTDESNLCSLLNINQTGISEFYREGMQPRLSGETEVKTISLDDFIDSEGIDDVDLIRMDIQGYEVTAIDGMIETFSKASTPCLCVIETHNKHFSDVKSTIGTLIEKAEQMDFSGIGVIRHDGTWEFTDPEKFVELVCSIRDENPQVVLFK